MRPPPWHPPVEPSPTEQTILRLIKRAKLFVFLRQHRHELFDDAFQQELAAIYKDSSFGHPPVPPAQLALATILQAYTGVSDDEVIEATIMDRRWQLVLDCLDCGHAPFSKGTLVTFRERLIAQTLDRRLIERTVELAARTKAVGSRQLRAALDSSPLWGAGRVEDTYNLLGHALRKAVGVIARQQGRGLAELATEIQVPLLTGEQSLKAALDCNWDDPDERTAALTQVLRALDTIETWLARQQEVPDAATAALTIAETVRDQDIETTPGNVVQLRRGVAKERRISVEDGEMRHGRKSRSHRFDGYKRHVLRDLDSGLVRAVGITPANVPEASVTDDVLADLAAQEVALREIHLDRGYLASHLVRDRSDDLAIYCKAWPVRNGDRYPKTAFVLDWEAGTIRCPNTVSIPFQPGATVHFPEDTCQACPLRERCTTSVHGRSVHIHPDERLLTELRQRQLTRQGRAKLRERIPVEHALAHIGRWQGARARYRGVRKNLFDLRRSAVVHNLHAIQRLPAAQVA
ncbi:MAG TPA: IS1182 family transposase [Chloroflexota bacterium]